MHKTFLQPVLPGNIFVATTNIVAIFIGYQGCRIARCMRSQPSPNAGGCDFPTDPDQPAGRAPLFWLPSLLPDALELHPKIAHPDDPAVLPVNLPELSCLDARMGPEGTWHGLWRTSDTAHQFWLPAMPPGVAAAYFVVLPLDALLERRAEAMMRFWRTLTGRSVGDQRHDLPAQTRKRHLQILRALDGRADGASYRRIAEVLLGFHGSKADWESDPRKNQVRRLIADGLRYVRGGYRDLLHYPIRLPRR